VFVTETSAPVHPSNLLKHFHKTLAAAELPKIRVHDLRHTCATLVLDEGIPLVTVSKILGHSSAAVTAKIYALDKSKASAIATLSGRFRRGQ
jgi:integrase